MKKVEVMPMAQILPDFIDITLIITFFQGYYLFSSSFFCPQLIYRIISGGPKIGRYLLVNQTVVVIDSPFYCTPIARVLYDPCN
jgi:hypothetical protein